MRFSPRSLFPNPKQRELITQPIDSFRDLFPSDAIDNPGNWKCYQLMFELDFNVT